MREVTSLISLCIEALKIELIHGDDLVPLVYDLPHELFDALVLRLPPLALQNLQTQMPFEDRNHHEFTDDCFRNGRKRGRHWNFNTAWRALVKLRWPDLVEQSEPVDWQQMYWEMHLQNCLDEAAETALLPSFNGCIGDIQIPDAILRCIGFDGQANHLTSDYSKLSYHCQGFGCYARCLRLQHILCTAETCCLLRNGKLQSLVLRLIRSKEHIDGLCKLLNQNSETLTSLEFIHCKLSSDFVNAICGSLLIKSMQSHGIQHFSINTSSLLENNLFSLPVGLSSFLSSGRSLCSLKFCDNQLGRNFAKLVFNTILDVSSSISILDLSENNISGWLSDFNKRSSSDPFSSLGIGKSLQSLRVLNLRGNNLRKDDAESLRYALVYIPNLEVLDLSDNFIEDEGIMSLIPYFVEASERSSSLADLNLENCELSCNGVTQLLNTLSTFKGPLKSLSLADNFLGSQVAVALGKYLHTSIEVLNVGGIGLGSSGFRELQEDMMEELKLVKINISKNHGGIETAKFFSKLVSLAPELVEVNAAYNFMPVESLSIICAALKVAKGNLERLDLMENTWDNQLAHASLLSAIKRNGKPIVILPLRSASDAPYDDDP
ncbi:protein nlrc3 [Fagus crenata]